jgi:hydroxyacylglutathione hydrolase
MKIERFEVKGLAQYSYVVSSEGVAAVVDAMRDVDRYTVYAKENGLRITHVLETHIHADFAAGSVALAEECGAELCLSGYDEGESYRYAMAHRAMRDGDAIEVGRVRMVALHTPGHTPEHLSFVVFDTEESEREPVALLSGDFLFVGSVGRPDLLGDAAKDGLAREMFRSLHRRIAGLPDDVAMYPGHGAGSLCGAGMRPEAESTLGHERVTDGLFRLGEEEFVREILESVPEMPAYYPRMKALNAMGAARLAGLPGGRALAVAEVAEMSRSGDVVVVDLRGVEAFAAGHVPGAVSLGAGASLSMWAGWLLDPEKRLVLVGDGGDEEVSRRALARVGLDRVEGHLAGGMAAWVKAGLEASCVALVSAEDVKRRLHSALVLDVRNDKEWESGHIAGAMHVPLSGLAGSLGELSRERAVISVCGSGYRASVAASLLARAGFGDVSVMEGGMGAWAGQD